ncbi:acyltransferase family protein [Undibacterium sp. MH2W]|uniref:acyltransferase family protein n=1 Tax=Undibacterium sp. MH2W TaxID=3413044 RepID=UPI003BF4344E
MGWLRFLLAFSVMWTHADLPHGFSGDLCVTVFFAISGFYMALILEENSSYKSIKTFYIQRILRIFPTYLFVLFLAIIFIGIQILNGDQLIYSRYLSELAHPVTVTIFWIASQLFILGQDAICFFGIDQFGKIIFEPSLTLASSSFSQTNIIPPAWSLSGELFFYALAPFVLRRSIVFISSLLLLSVATRLTLANQFDFVSDPWATRFFPSEFCFFMAGALGYKLITAKSEIRDGAKYLIYLLLVMVSVSALSVTKWTHSNSKFTSFAVLFIVFVLISVIPFLFSKTKNSRIDRQIGEISFPLYVCHILVFQVGHYFFRKSTMVDLSLVSVTMLFAVTIIYCVDQPINNFRHSLLATKNN